MGAMKAPEPVELPDQLTYLYLTYKRVKFSTVNNPEYDGTPNTPRFLLIPRIVLNCVELEAFSRVSEMNLQHWEIETLLCIDSIFERSRG